MDEATAGVLAIHRACHQAQAQAHESIIADQAAIIANLWTVLGWTGFKPEQVCPWNNKPADRLMYGDECTRSGRISLSQLARSDDAMGASQARFSTLPSFW